MELRELGRALRRGWWLILAGIAVCVAGAGGICALQTPEYSSSTQFFVATPTSSDATDALQGGVFSQQRVVSYTRLLTGPVLGRRVIDRLGLDSTTDELSGEITATADIQSVLIDVTVTDPSAARAQQIAETINTEFPALVTELETAGQGGASPVSVVVTGEPHLPGSPSSPNVVQALLIGAGVGLLLGIGLAIARSRLDRTVKDPAEAAELAGAPLIGTVLRDGGLQKRHVVPAGLPSASGEAFRQLRNNLQFLNVDEPPKVIMITSALPSEGKTTAAINLGLALVQAGRRVTIVDADLRAAKVASYLDAVSGAGLTNVLTGSADLDDVLQPYGDGECRILAAGPTPPNPGELLASASMARVLEKLRSDNDFVIVDSPPLLPLADSTGLSVHVDGAVLAVHYGRTRKDQLEQAAAALERVGGRVLGVLLNIVPPRADLARSLGQGYGYGYGPGSKVPPRTAG